ncbi:hypothetical protein, partial [Escherichia coli]|uniref:hypothetical protein n=1 Tax=Escherichia coli TaxID=562 RepID=UPI001C403F68
MDATKPRNAWGESRGFVELSRHETVCAALHYSLPAGGKLPAEASFPETVNAACGNFNEESRTVADTHADEPTRRDFL